MKTLLVLRHAKALRDAPTGEDFDRALDERGRAAALSIGHQMRAGDLVPDAILASPARRVVETVEAVAEGLGEPLDAEFEPRLYNATTADLLEAARAAPEDCDRLLVVGHIPGLQDLVLYLAEPDPEGLRDMLTEKFPTAALAVLELPIDDWHEVRQASAQLVSVLKPRDG
jgi:phosphohistidine phosphatase